MKTFLNELGIEAILFIAGLAGGVTSLSTKPKNMTRSQQFLSVLAGGFTANYLTPLTGSWLNLSDNTLYGVAFLLGYSGLKAVELLMKKFFSKIEESK
ncbi:MAG TPA: hypothetical protein VKY44_09475 [Flavobacterium sp.]|nr:hypothetical protein [Flavobacterium sp.]